MKYNSKRQQELYSHKVYMDVRQHVIDWLADGRSLSLSDYCRDIDNDDAADRIRDSVRRLAQARINLKPSEYIEGCKGALCDALEKSYVWSHSKPIKQEEMTKVADAIDEAVVTSITRHEMMSVIQNKRV
jgi:hypothetical protein